MTTNTLSRSAYSRVLFIRNAFLLWGLVVGMSAGAVAIGQTIHLTAYNSDGTNTGTARMGSNVSIVANVQGTLSTAITWSVTGAGTVSGGGLYTAPAAMPSTSSVTVTARLVSNTSISASYQMTLINS